MRSTDDIADRGVFATALVGSAGPTLDSLGRVRRYPAGSTLFRQGEPSRHVAVLVHGWVKVVAASRDGEEAILALRGPGDVLGELSAIDGEPRSATVSALVSARARIIPGDHFLNTVLAAPELSLALLRHLTTHLRDSDRKRLEYVSTGTFQRLVILLVELASRYGERQQDGTTVIQLPLTQRDLATSAAMSREAVARGLRTLRERDLVRTERRQIVITRLDLVRTLAVLVHDDT